MNNDITGPSDSFVEAAPTLFSQPTAQEMLRLTHGSCDLRIGVQEEEEEEVSNDFAHLLNRGSSLE